MISLKHKFQHFMIEKNEYALCNGWETMVGDYFSNGKWVNVFFNCLILMPLN